MPDREDEARALLREAADGLTDWCNGRDIDHEGALNFLARIKEYLEKDGER